MNRTPRETAHRAVPHEPTQPNAHEGATRRRDERREQRLMRTPARMGVDRRWRFADAVAAARQLSSGGASAG